MGHNHRCHSGSHLVCGALGIACSLACAAAGLYWAGAGVQSAHRDTRRQVVDCNAVVEEGGEQLDGLPGDDPGRRKNK